jgi:hypothetical protein
MLVGVKSFLPPEGGATHLAGVLADATIRNLSRHHMERPYLSKVYGADHLLKGISPACVDFFVMFSSITAVFGSQGQANYAAANSCLDGMAAARLHLGHQVLSIQWGAWSDAGMAVEKDAVAHFQNLGYGALSNELGVSILCHVLRARGGVVAASPFDWPAFLKKLHE